MFGLPCCTTIFLSTPSVRRATTIADLLLMFGKFLSTPSVRRATLSVAFWVFMALVFLSTPSVRRATLMRELAIRIKDISIHALREEGDTSSSRWRDTSRHFYPRPP